MLTDYHLMIDHISLYCRGSMQAVMRRFRYAWKTCHPLDRFGASRWSGLH
jgi:hypothetical protein